MKFYCHHCFRCTENKHKTDTNPYLCRKQMLHTRVELKTISNGDFCEFDGMKLEAV